ncbi:hypothetical protein K488DRAFT_75367, partial [Vararia minispora EC-137]
GNTRPYTNGAYTSPDPLPPTGNGITKTWAKEEDTIRYASTALAHLGGAAWKEVEYLITLHRNFSASAISLCILRFSYLQVVSYAEHTENDETLKQLVGFWSVLSKLDRGYCQGYYATGNAAGCLRTYRPIFSAQQAITAINKAIETLSPKYVLHLLFTFGARWGAGQTDPRSRSLNGELGMSLRPSATPVSTHPDSGKPGFGAALGLVPIPGALSGDQDPGSVWFTLHLAPNPIVHSRSE